MPVESAQVSIFGKTIRFENLSKNTNNVQQSSAFGLKETLVSQPYWIEYPLQGEAFQVKNQQLIGLPEAENNNLKALFQIQVNGELLTFDRKIMYKHTDPVKGELYQPAQFVYPFFINASPSLVLLRNDESIPKKIAITIQPNISLKEKTTLSAFVNNQPENFEDTVLDFTKGASKTFHFTLYPKKSVITAQLLWV